MAVRVVFEIRFQRGGDDPVSRLLDAHPTLRQETRGFALEDPDISIGTHRITGPPDAVDALFEVRRTRSEGAGHTVRLLYRAPGDVVFTHAGPPYGKQERKSPGWEKRVAAVAWRILGQERFFEEKLVTTGRAARWHLVTDHEAALPEFIRTVARHCRESATRDFRLVSIHPYTPEGEEGPELTARQEEALLAAWRVGHYDGKAQLRHVADALGMSTSGLHGLLRRAERAVIGEAVQRIARRARPEEHQPRPGPR